MCTATVAAAAEFHYYSILLLFEFVFECVCCSVCMLCSDVIFDLNSNKINNFFLHFHFHIHCQAFPSHKLYGCCLLLLLGILDSSPAHVDGALKILNYAFAVFFPSHSCRSRPLARFMHFPHPRRQFSFTLPTAPTTRICVIEFCCRDASVWTHSLTASGEFWWICMRVQQKPITAKVHKVFSLHVV